MKEPNTTVRADAKLQNLPEAALDELWALRHPEIEGDKVWTLTDVAAWVPGRFNFQVSTSAVGNFYQWLELKRRMDARNVLADQLKLALAQDPNFSEEQIKKAGQKLFMAEGIIEKDARVFKAMADSTQDDARLAQNREIIQLKKAAGKRDERKLAILEKKAAQADAAQGVSNDGTLTDEEKAAKLKQIFRMG